MFNTKAWFLLVVLLYVSACSKPAPQEHATLTLKKDGSHFSGTVIRRETNSITLTSVDGAPHTYLWTEIKKISYSDPDPAQSGGSASSLHFPVASGTSPVRSGSSPGPIRTDVVAPADGVLQFAAGTEFPIRSDGFIDSCCAPINSTVVGLLDKDMKNGKGQVVIPEGTTFVIILVEEKVVDGRRAMTFALASADFGGRHYGITATNGPTESGALVTFTGAKSGTPEATLRGLSIHLDDHSFMGL